ncbi:MAG: YhcH/YjgK/YiaL family protein [Bacteroidaceae bacterium]|nr:YhcH/YjgK/YiaL family protein [Bacteroidaceae bacterium]
MIYDKLANINRYYGLNPNLDCAIDYISGNFDEMPDHVDLNGNDVYGNIFTYSTVPEQESFFEAHALYADIQIMRDGSERVAVSDISVLNEDEAHPDRDFWALSGTEEVTIVLAPGSFLIVMPGDAHKLKMQIGESAVVTKSVFKVKVK